ncbi:MAG: sulfatase [Phycisphaerae bacterium]|jgi:N-sulfoglucosamine sulfohydrolase|nr:sulfatase [Phycisphaerae bacterium]
MNSKACGRRHFLRVLTTGACGSALAGSMLAQQMAPPKKRPNILMIVADDMNWDTPGCFGGAAPKITPNIDSLAAEGIRFSHAYVNASICTPSRSVILTGLFPHNNGVEGFQRIRPGTATLPAILNKAGYLCGIIGKPLRQQELFRWSVTYRWKGVGDEDRWGRDPGVYRRFAGKFFEMARTSGQPFFLMANSHDPHRPFAGGKATRKHDQRVPASRTFRAEEVRVPKFLPDLPAVRKELAAYCTSVRRLDDMVGGVLDELAKAKLVDNTIVIFLSDHGMPFPSAKFNCYVDGMRSPWIIRWPGRIKKAAIDRTHMISAVDLQPTILEAVGLPPTRASDGRSFLPLLHGQTQSNRDCVFTQFYHIHGKDALPMQSVLTREYAYVFNPWSNGKRRFTRLGGAAFGAMQKAAKTDAVMADRIRHLVFRTVEEFYDLRADPNCLVNLLKDAPDGKMPGDKRREQIDLLRGRLRKWMVRVKAPVLGAFDNRYRPDALEKFMQTYRAKAAREVEALKPYEKANDYRF